MLGAEVEIIDQYVTSGQVQLIYWPMLDHAENSLNAHAAADCVSRIDIDAFWEIHDFFYLDQQNLWGAKRDYFVNAAISVGVDETQFATCYDDRIGHNAVQELDRIRKERGIRLRPSFTVNGQPLYGSQSFATFQQIIDVELGK